MFWEYNAIDALFYLALPDAEDRSSVQVPGTRDPGVHLAEAHWTGSGG